MKSKNDTQKGARIKFCTRQYLYISEYLGLGLGRRLYFPSLEELDSFLGIFSAVGLLMSSVEEDSLCIDGGCVKGLHVFSASVLDSDTCLELSF